MSGSVPPGGALVISLDFELRWGVRDHCPPGSSYERNLLGAREVIPRILKLFEEFEVGATWATVGLLFARDRAEARRFRPALLPAYENSALDPFRDETGADEATDPLHFAPSLIERIASTPRQEIGTHTFSHYFCNEAGSTEASFAADLDAAVGIACTRDIDLRSIVFPRNQFNSQFLRVLRERGITAYRGNPPSWMWRFADREESASRLKRAARIADAYVDIGGNGSFGWDEVMQTNGLADVRASHFVRPFNPRLRHLEPLRLARMRRAVSTAARGRGLVHIWWHPHNFGGYQDECLAFLRGLLEEYARCREHQQMESLTMAEVADRAARMPTSTLAAGRLAAMANGR